MPTYIYKARDSTGRAVSGTMEAPARTELIDRLNSMGYMATKVLEAGSGIRAGSIFEKFKRVKSEDMLMFYIQFSNMINAGIPILTSLSTLAKQIENKSLRDIISNVARQIEGGSALSQALAVYNKIFPRLFVNMVKAGETSGKLDGVLMRYAVFFERQEEVREKAKEAIFYPVILLSFGIAIILFIVTFVIPQFAQIYIKAGVKLPAPTLIVYKAGLAVKNFWQWVLAFLIALFVMIKLYSTTPGGMFLLDTLKLRIPIIGSLHRKAAISRITRTLSTLLGSGVPILESLDIAKEVAGNEVLGRIIADVRKYVERGEKIAQPLKISGEFPPDVVQMVSVGEESGNLDGMLNKIADFYDMTVNYAIKKLTTIIEPVFLVIMGCMVGIIMASMLMPIFDMVKTLRH